MGETGWLTSSAQRQIQYKVNKYDDYAKMGKVEGLYFCLLQTTYFAEFPEWLQPQWVLESPQSRLGAQNQDERVHCYIWAGMADKWFLP